MIGISSPTTGSSRRINPWQRMRRVIRDLAELLMLQGRLADIDFREWRVGLGATLGLIAVGVSALIGSVPVLVYCLAVGIQNWTAISLTTALWLAGGVTFALGVILGGVGWYRFISSFAAFDRSRAELARNLEWVKGRMSSDRPRDFFDDSNN